MNTRLATVITATAVTVAALAAAPAATAAPAAPLVYHTFNVPGATGNVGTAPDGINRHGVVVGIYFDTQGVEHGFLVNTGITRAASPRAWLADCHRPHTSRAGHPHSPGVPHGTAHQVGTRCRPHRRDAMSRQAAWRHPDAGVLVHAADASGITTASVPLTVASGAAGAVFGPSPPRRETTAHSNKQAAEPLNGQSAMNSGG